MIKSKQDLGVPTVVQRVKNLALPQLWCRLQLQLDFDPWPRNFHMSWAQLKKKKKNIYQLGFVESPKWNINSNR